jgi:N6-adenosine-specific RNA methylase IME4
MTTILEASNKRTPPLIGGASARKLKAHPAAELFPMMSDAEIADLGADIKAQGQRRPIVILDGLILDGRNRYEACRRAGIEPRLEQWSGASSPTAYVLSENLQRRHLTVDQRALIALEAQPLFATEAKARQRAAGGDRKSKAQDRLPPRGGKRSEERAPTAAAQAAETAGVSARSVERAQRVQAARPELLAQVRAGKMSLKKAEKAVAKGERLREVLTYVPPKGRYSVIVADPSWKYDDQLDGSDAIRGGVDYPPMELEEICAMKIGETIAAPDCALWLWVPNGFLLDGQVHQVLRAWGFEPKALLTWTKDRWGGGHYLRGQTEHVILAIRGRPVIQGESTASFFHAKRGAHSEKPDEAYPIFEKVTPCAPGARLDLFACKTRKGWVSSGAELAHGEAPSKRKGSPKKSPPTRPTKKFPLQSGAREQCTACGHVQGVHDGTKCPSPTKQKRSRSKVPCSICGEQDGHLPSECALNEANQ